MSNDTEETVDELTAFIEETVDYIERETGERPPVYDVQFSVAVQGGVSFMEDDSLYNTLVLLTTDPSSDGLTPIMVAVPKPLYSDLFDPTPEEETPSE